VNFAIARRWFGLVVRVFLGAIWIWAAWEKLRQPRDFLLAVRAYDATPEWLSKAIAYGLPTLEFCLGVLLVLGLVVRLAAIVSAALFVVFLVGIVQAAARGLQLECGCFGGGGISDKTQYTIDILRDIGLLVLAGYLIVWSLTAVSVDAFLGRHDYVAPPSAKRLRSDQGWRKYNAMVETRRKQARDRTLYLSSSLAVVVLLVSFIGIGVQSGRAKIQGTLTATHASVNDGIVYGKEAAATVDIYEDFQCPACEAFEQQSHAWLDDAVTKNLAQVRFHIMAFLDPASNGNRYSSRAANAGICASDVSVDFFVAYHNVLYGTDPNGNQIQPKEGTSGRSDLDLIKYATFADIPTQDSATFASCVRDEQHKALVSAITDNASKAGVVQTPTIKVNGKTLKSHDLKSLQAAIAAANKGVTPHPSPTTSPSPSASGSSTRSTSPAARPTTSGSPTP
jgi:protein-disulfide isomerase/uncharacterized membrane protein YphA (DoxX/SURF4 family)